MFSPEARSFLVSTPLCLSASVVKKEDQIYEKDTILRNKRTGSGGDVPNAGHRRL